MNILKNANDINKQLRMSGKNSFFLHVEEKKIYTTTTTTTGIT